MKVTAERRHDDELRGAIDQAIEYKKSLGQHAAVSFLVDQNVPPPLIQRVLLQEVKFAVNVAA